MDDKKGALMMVGLGVLLLALLSLLPAVAAPTAIIDPGTGNTTLIFQNRGSNTASVMVQYIDENGNTVGTKPSTVNRYGAGVIKPGSSGLPDGWRGSAVLSSNQPLAAVVQISWSGQGKVGAAYSGLFSPGREVYLPDVATSSGTDTQITVQNAGAADAQVYLDYYTAKSGSLKASKGPYAIPVGAETTLDVSGAVGTSWSGSVRITSTVDIAAVATRHWTSKSAAYQGVSSGSDHLYFPLIYRWKKEGTWRRYTQVQVQNLSDNQATFKLSFYDRSGNLKNLDGQPYEVTVPARGTLRFNMKSGGGGLSRSQVNFGNNWNGSLVVTSTVQMAGTANEILPKEKRAGASSAESSGSTRIYLPSLYRKKIRTRWVNFSEISIQNVGDSEAKVNIKFYLRNGTLKKTLWGITIPRKASYRITTKQTKLKVLGDKFLGTAVIIARQGNVVALVYNKTGPRSHIYNGLSQ